MFAVSRISRSSSSSSSSSSLVIQSLLRNGGKTLLSPFRATAAARVVVLPTQQYTTTTIATNQAPSSLPQNLQLADPDVLAVEEEVSAVEGQVKDYAFPLLNVPTSVTVASFTKPGEIVGPIPLEKKIFEVAIRKDIILNAIRYTRHRQRQPKKTKRMSEIRGSNKKPRPQKGTGSSQVGHRRNSAWRGGQKAHGPVIRDYSISINKKSRALAMMMALAAKFREGNLYIFDELLPESHKTKELVTLLRGHGLIESDDRDHNKLLLFVDETFNEVFGKAVNNLDKTFHLTLRQVNTYEVVRAQKLAISKQAFQQLQERLLGQYLNRGKGGALEKAFDDYYQIVEEGQTLLQQQQQQPKQ